MVRDTLKSLRAERDRAEKQCVELEEKYHGKMADAGIEIEKLKQRLEERIDVDTALITMNQNLHLVKELTLRLVSEKENKMSRLPRFRRRRDPSLGRDSFGSLAKLFALTFIVCFIALVFVVGL